MSSVSYVDFTLTRAGTTGWSAAVTLTGMGYRGKILRTVLRKDASLNDATTVNVYVADAALTTKPVQRLIFYQNEGLACGAGHATDAFLDVVHDPPRPYHVTASPGSPGTAPRVAVNVTATAGGTTTSIEGRVYYERHH